MIDKVITKWGKLHILVNSAGVGAVALTINRKGEVPDTKTVNFVLGVNVVGTFTVSKYAV